MFCELGIGKKMSRDDIFVEKGIPRENISHEKILEYQFA
jgi:hypothetical protein